MVEDVVGLEDADVVAGLEEEYVREYVVGLEGVEDVLLCAEEGGNFALREESVV